MKTKINRSKLRSKLDQYKESKVRSTDGWMEKLRLRLSQFPTKLKLS